MELKTRLNSFFTNKKAVFLSLTAFFLTCTTPGILLFLHYMPEEKYRIKLFITKTFSSCRPEMTDTLQTELFTYSELEGDSRIIFDRSMMLINSENLLQTI